MNTKTKPTIDVVGRRMKQHQALEKKLLKKLNEFLDLDDNTSIVLSRSHLDINVLGDDKKVLFASGIELANQRGFMETQSKMAINFGSSGSFTPKDKAPTIRTHHANQVLMNWKQTEMVVLAFMEQLERLQESWKFENNF